MKVLIIEDAEILRNSIRIALEEFGYIVDSTGCGAKGLSMALVGEYNIIVLDLMLPNMDGYTVLKEIRNKKVDTGVIILSAREETPDKIKGLDLGADDYLCKPFSINELEARLRAILRRRANLHSELIKIGDIQLHRAQKTLTVNDSDLELTPSEYIIIEDLIFNQGKVRSYGQLQAALKNDFEQLSQNAIEAHISCIRRKLRLLNVDDFILTKRSFGYMVK